MAFRLGMDPMAFISAEGIERTIREAVTAVAEKNRQEELRAVLDAIATMLGAKT